MMLSSNPSDAAALLHALDAPVARLDGALRLTMANPAFARALGLAHDALAGSDLAGLLGDAGAALQARLAAGAHAFDFDRDGRWWRAAASPMPQGGWALHLADITREKTHERERQRLTELLDMAQEFGRLGVWERDVRTLEGRWDHHMFRFWDMDPTDGTPNFVEAARRVHPDDRLGEHFEASLQRPGVYSRRFRVLRPDGEVRQLHSQWLVVAGPDGVARRVVGIMMDDTEAFHLARAVQDANAQLGLALELAHIGTWRHDFASGRFHHDATVLRSLGREARAEGRTLEEVRSWIHPDDLPAVLDSAERALATGQPVDMSARYRHADGSWRELLARRVLQRDAAGKPVGFIGVALDTTERVEQARRAAQLADRLDRAARRARIGLWSTALEGGTDWSPLMFELFGLDPAQGPPSFGEWLRRCVHEEDRARVAQLSRAWMAHGEQPYEVEFRVPGSGHARWVALRGDIEPSPDGSRRLYGVAMDVTAHHEALERLRAAAERSALVASGVGIGTWEHDVPTATDHWDAQMYRLRGFEPRPQPPGMDERQSHIHPDDRARVREAYEQLRRSWRKASQEFRVVLPDGRVRWIASRSAPVFDDQGRLVRRIGVNWDITDARTTELAQRERELAQRESEAKSRFLARMSHELRTPLNAVLGFTQLVLAEDDGTDDADDAALRRRRLGHVRTAGQHLLSLIDDVLDLSSLEGGELRLKLAPVALPELVRATLPMLEHAAGELQLRLETGALEGVVLADERRLRQVLLNLLSNAVKYNRPGGRVLVQATRDGERVRLAVRDSGRGISREQAQRLFEPFERLGVEREGIEGTGIGLTIVKALVERMGGELRMSSTPGEGSCFEVLLRAAAAPGEAAAPSGAARAGAPARRQRVLYIEDNEINLLIVAELMARRPALDFHSAASGEDGLASALAEPPDLVLLDMHLPDMDGHQVLARLRADPRTAALPCVAVSANAMAEDIERALAAGFVAYWTKPLDFAAFLGWIDGYFALDAAA